MGLKRQAEEENGTPSGDLGKTFGDSWRPAAEDTQTPHLPFIYCIFNSEHLVESQPEWPLRPHI